MVGKLGVITLGMFAFGYALVPIYRAICEVTGINILALVERQVPGTKRQVASQHAGGPQRTITVEFDVNTRGPWHFKPAVRSLQVHPGELTTVLYEFQNIQNRTMSAQAIPELCAQAGGFALQQAGVLLLQPVHTGAGRKERVAGGFCDRSQAVQRRDHHHAVLHLL